MAKKDEVAVLRKFITKTTESWAKDVYEIEDKQTEKAKQVGALLEESSWGKQDKERLAKMLSVLTGEEIKLPDNNELELAPLAAFYVTKLDEKNKHTYATNTVIIHTGDGVCVGDDGKTGSPIQPRREVIRPATKAEIDAIPDAQLKGVMKEVNIVFAS